MRRSTVLAMGLFLGASAPADSMPCDNAVTQSDLDRCAARTFQAADAALNAAYRTVTDRLSGSADARKLLIDAQKAWLAFRDTECTFATSRSRGGSIHPMAELGCRSTLTDARTKMLRAYLTCQEGDTGCPVSR